MDFLHSRYSDHHPCLINTNLLLLVKRRRIDVAAKPLREACELFSFQQDRTASLWHAVKKGVVNRLVRITAMDAFWRCHQSRHEESVADPKCALNYQPGERCLVIIKTPQATGGILIVCLVEDIALPETRRGTHLGSNCWLPRHRIALRKPFLASYHYHHLMVNSDLTVI